MKLPTVATRRLGSATALRHLALSSCERGEEWTAWLAQGLPLLWHLETLRVPFCGVKVLPALAGGPAPPLRLLDISSNENCTIPGARWLTSLEQLKCNWWQVRCSALTA